MRDDMGEVKIPGPQMVKPDEAFPPDADIHIGGFWTTRRYPKVAVKPAVFPGLDEYIHPVPARPSWASQAFFERHFELVGWETWRWWPVAVPGTEDVNLAREAVSISIFRLCDRPVIVAMISPYPWWVQNPAAMSDSKELRFYRLKWRLWWRRVDPMKDAKLCAILEGAVALDALAGRDP